LGVPMWTTTRCAGPVLMSPLAPGVEPETHVGIVARGL
jgi:hypothetical protein